MRHILFSLVVVSLAGCTGASMNRHMDKAYDAYTEGDLSLIHI